MPATASGIRPPARSNLNTAAAVPRRTHDAEIAKRAAEAEQRARVDSGDRSAGPLREAIQRVYQLCNLAMESNTTLANQLARTIGLGGVQSPELEEFPPAEHEMMELHQALKRLEDLLQFNYALSVRASAL